MAKKKTTKKIVAATSTVKKKRKYTKKKKVKDEYILLKGVLLLKKEIGGFELYNKLGSALQSIKEVEEFSFSYKRAKDEKEIDDF